MKNHKELVLSFIESMKEVRSDVNYTFVYDQNEDRYLIYHSYANAHEDREFRRKMSNLYAKLFSLNSYYSVSIILNRQMISYNFVDTYIPNEVSKIKSSIEVKNDVEIKLDSCSENLDASNEKWNIYSDDENKSNIDLAA
jgi:hypothetical protein